MKADEACNVLILAEQLRQRARGGKILAFFSFLESQDDQEPAHTHFRTHFLKLLDLWYSAVLSDETGDLAATHSLVSIAGEDSANSLHIAS